MISSISTVASYSSDHSFSSGYGFERTTRSSAQPGANAALATGSDDGAGAAQSTAGQLTPEQLQQVQQLAQADRKVRAHEQAHLAVAADLARGGASFSYQTGPDRRQYAVSGEVSIDVSPARTPQETVAKAQRIRAAALAPADPSAQDNRVAALARRMEFDARTELAAQAAQAVQTTHGMKSTDVTSNAQARQYSEVAQSGYQRSRPGFSLDLFA